MKKFIITLFLLISFFFSNAQSYYVATATELYTFNSIEKEWQLYQKNGSTNITIVIEEEFLSIHANSPTMYKLYKSSAKDISSDKIEGIRYDALDLKKNEVCKIDIVKFDDTNYVISVVKGLDFNLRYYIKLKQ